MANKSEVLPVVELELLLEPFKKAFGFRPDVFAVYFEYIDRATSKLVKGYRPRCSNRDAKSYVPISDDFLLGHFNGEYILGMYPLFPDNTCWFIAVDFDNHEEDKNPLNDVQKFHVTCDINEIPCYVLRSKSGNGYHVYIFLTKPVPAWKARLVVNALLKEAQLTGDDAVNSSFCSIFPKQDEHSKPGDIGNLISMPFQGKAMQSGHTLLLDQDSGFTSPYDNQIEALKNVERVSEEKLDSIMAEWELTTSTMTNSSGNTKVNTRSKRPEDLFGCVFLKHAYESQATLKEPLWYAMLSNVLHVGFGGKDLCHEFSKGHSGYSRKSCDDKILGATNTGPHSCRHIKENGFDCKKDCGVKSPIGLFSRGSHKPSNAPPHTPTIGNNSDSSVLISWTDKDVGKRFVDTYQNEIRHCHQVGKWYLYHSNEGVWAIDNTNKITELYGKMLDNQMSGIIKMPYDSEAQSEKRISSIKKAANFAMSSRKKGVLDFAVGDQRIAVRINDLDAHNDLLNCKNGTLELSTWTFREHRPG